ncbi:hypothetical protein D3C72_2425210 [compost metagenome]
MVTAIMATVTMATAITVIVTTVIAIMVTVQIMVRRLHTAHQRLMVQVLRTVLQPITVRVQLMDHPQTTWVLPQIT